MKSIKTLLIGALLGFSASTMAQASYTDADGNKYEFQPHWFLDLQGGAQYTVGEAKFDKLLSPNVQVALGRQFKPWLGLRLQANAWQSKGGWNGYVPVGGGYPFTRSYKYNYVAPGLDILFDLTNAIGGYNPKRLVSLAAFLGGGANIGFGNEEVNDIASHLQNTDAYLLNYVWDGSKVRLFGRGGLQLGFRLSDAIKLKIEGNANILSDKYNSKKSERNIKGDWYFNALIGLQINLGKTYNKILPPPPAPEPEPQPVVEQEPAPAPAPAPVVVEPIRRDVFFLINKTEIRAEEAQKVKDIADYMQKYPKSKVVVTGYADAGTGNDKINDRLAAGRADAVVKSLINDYGIAQDRITYDSKGSRVQPFAENDMNRVTICIAE